MTVSTRSGRTDWSTRTVVVTGASGGVGRATAEWLAKQGATIFSLDRRRRDDVVGTFVEVDVLDELSVEAAIAEVCCGGSTD